MIDIKVPTVGESINEVTLVKWLKKEGDYVERDEVIAELESEKATFEVNAEKAGVLKTVGKEGDTLNIGDTLAQIDEAATKPIETTPQKTEVPKQQAQPSVNNKPAVVQAPQQDVKSQKQEIEVKATPVASAIIADKKVDPKTIQPSGFNGKILKDDVLSALEQPGRKPGVEPFNRTEGREKMSNLRRTVSRRLVEAKNTTAMLTTFNEVDMSKIMSLRTQYKDKFKEKHGVGLGFMSFFTKAVFYALQEWPAENAYIDGDSIVYHN